MAGLETKKAKKENNKVQSNIHTVNLLQEEAKLLTSAIDMIKKRQE